MERIVLDTNCLLAILTRKSPMHYMWQRILSGDIVMCVTDDILLEYEEILSDKSSPQIAQLVMFQLENIAETERISTYYKWNIITQDPDDNKFVDCAIAANAKFVVSNDNHFNVLKNKDIWPKVELKTLKEYHRHLMEEK